MNQPFKNFRTYDLAVQFYRDCKSVELGSSLRDQLTRATESIVLNLAEGSAKPTLRDRSKFFHIALGSFRESQAILSLADQISLLSKHDQLGACLYKLTQSTLQ